MIFYAGIVGARRRTDQDRVKLLVCKLEMTYGYLTVVSGGCAGPDTWAVETARNLGIQVIEHLPELPPPGSPRWMWTKAYYARNKLIAETCTELWAFVRGDRRGGTESAISYARHLNKRVNIIMPDGTRVTIEPKVELAQAGLTI